MSGGADSARKKIPQISVLGLAVAAVVALSGAPGLGVAGNQPVTQPSGGSGYQAAAFVQPVQVSLLSGVDALNWQSLGITSTADAFGQGATTQLHSSGIIVGQSVGVLGALPGGIQLMHPVQSRHITSPYGWRHNPTGPGTQIHIGQDYAVPCGSPVYATADGIVIQSAWAGHSGMRVTIDHGTSVETGYSHNSRLIAKVGDSVKQGQLIAFSGTTGNSTGCHVHFEVIINGRWNDPRNFLPPVSGQPNPMIDSRRTTIAAAPIRNTGAPGASAAEVGDFPARWVSVPRAHTANPAPARHRAPVATPQEEPQATHQARSKAKPAPLAKPRTNSKPAPSIKPKPPTSAAPKPSATPPSQKPATKAPVTTAPAPRTEAPSTSAPTLPAPSNEAPASTTPLPEVNEIPTHTVPLPVTDDVEPASGPVDAATDPKAPEVKSESESSVPTQEDPRGEPVNHEPAKQGSEKQVPPERKEPAVEQPPVQPVAEAKAQTEAARVAPEPSKPKAALAGPKKVAAPSPRKAVVDKVRKVEKATAPQKPVAKPAAPKAPVAKAATAAPKKAGVPAPSVAKAKAKTPAAAPATDTAPKALADAGQGSSTGK